MNNEAFWHFQELQNHGKLWSGELGPKPKVPRNISDQSQWREEIMPRKRKMPHTHIVHVLTSNINIAQPIHPKMTPGNVKLGMRL